MNIGLFCVRQPTKEVEPRNRRNSSLYIPSSLLHHLSLFPLYLTHRQHSQLSQYHATYKKQCLFFENTPNNLCNFVCYLWAFFGYMQLYHNANASDVDLFSTYSDGMKGQLQRSGEGNCYCKNADIGYQSTPAVGSGSYNRIHLGTHLSTYTDIKSLWCEGWEGTGPLLWYNISWSSYDSPLLTNQDNVAALQEQQIAITWVVRSLPLRHKANVWPNLQPNEQLEVGKPPCLPGSSRYLQFVDNQLGEDYTHQ